MRRSGSRAAEIGPADVRLLYNCTDADVCNRVRLQAVYDDADPLPDGRWYQGCYAVTKEGKGYGAEDLDIELRYQSEACREP